MSKNLNLSSPKIIFVVGTIFLSLLFLMPQNTVFGQEDGKGLFSPPIEADEDQIADVDLSNVKRSQFVTVNSEMLKPSFSLNNADAPPNSIIQLNIFENIVLDAQLLKIDQLDNDGFAWTGTIIDRPHSQVTFIVRDKNVTGNIRIPNALIELRPVDGDLHVLKDMDLSAFTFDEGNDAQPIPAEDRLGAEAPSDFSVSNDDGTVIDIMVVYSEAARIAAGGTAAMESLIDLGFAETNTTYANSGVNFTVRKVHTYETTYASSGSALTDLNRLTSTTDGFMDDVHTNRDTYGADMVSLWLQGGGCGIGWLWSSSSYAFSVARRDCATGNLTFGHELGHNFGARHDWFADDTIDNPTYNHGFVNSEDGWRTVMAYNSDCAAQGFNCTRLTRMSNPAVSIAGDPTGVAGGTSTSCVEGNVNNPPCDADNVSILNSRAFTVANFRQAIPEADDWTFNTTGSYVPGSNSQIQVTGTGTDWSAQFWRKDGSTFGSGNRVSFEFYVDQKDSKTHLSIVKDGGDLERFALIDSNGGLNVSIYRPAEAVPNVTQPLLNSTEFQANTWYSASITVDDQYGSFITVEQRDDPSVSATYRDTDGLLSTGSLWSFYGIMYQHTVFLDNYLEEAVTLTPPPADDWIFRNDSGSYVPGSQSQIQVNGAGSNWSAQFLRKDESTFGSGNRVSFEFYVDQKDSKTHLSILKDGGTVERFALVDSGGGLNVSIYRPAETVPNFTQQLLNSTEFQANTWYSASITVDDQYGSFITVEQRDDPSVSGSFRDTDGLLSTGSLWSFFGIMYQHSVFLDNYLEEAVTLTPPPADDWIFRNDSGAYVPGSETQIQVNGTGSNWSAQFLRKDGSTFGSGNRVSFEFYVDQKDSKTHLSILKDGGNVERFALVDSGGGLNVSIYRPAETVPNFTQQLLDATEFQANTWYSASITVDDQYGSFITVEQRDDPSVSGSFRDTDGLLATGSQWSFFGIMYQYSVFLDNYLEEAVTLTQPPADDWTFRNDSGGYVPGSETQIQVNGTGSNWSAQFLRKPKSTFGTGNQVSFDFYVDQKDSKVHLSLVKDGGSYERFALVDSGGGLNANIYRPGEAVPNFTQQLLNATEFQANTWYSATITLDDVNGSQIEVEQRDDPTVNGSFQDTAGLLSTGSQWSFFGILFQHSVFVDNYAEMATP